ncbi:MAG TPA: hypothetical protein VKY26_09745 [Actinomycetota bacterium]|nr:hypothetical protein [Actinomycetota bacterium]
MLVQFYSAFAPISFTVLGLWFIVVQTRHAEWARSQHHRRTASVVALQFGLPGLMSLLSLVAPTSHTMWRVSFTVASLVGAAALLALSFGPAGGPRLAGAGRWLSAALFAVVAVVALAPGLPADLGLQATALAVEATLLSLLVFVGLAVAWLLLFTGMPPVPPAPSSPAPSSPAAAQP